jgi:hypothetical protein
MAKPPAKEGFNPGAATVAAQTEATAAPHVHRELPAVDVDPSTSPEAARLIASATTASVGTQPSSSPTPPAASTEAQSGGIIVDKLRVSMTAEAKITLDDVERTYRRVTGENLSSGRVLRAGLRILAALPQEQLIQAIEAEPEAAAGRPKPTR